MRETNLNPRKAHRILLVTGLLFLSFGFLLAGRIVWEETWLTWHLGPQMIGFSLAHGYYAPLLIAPIFVAGWLLTAAIVAARDRFRRVSPNRWLITLLALSTAVLVTLSLPETTWQWAFTRTFARSAHAGDLMTYAAALGATQTVRGYLDRNVPVEFRTYEGSTAAFTAAAGGSVSVLRLLSARGANLNAINSYGDSPLEVAISNRHDDAANFLRSHGARRVTGSAEQRAAASKAIVDREIEREEHLR